MFSHCSETDSIHHMILCSFHHDSSQFNCDFCFLFRSRPPLHCAGVPQCGIFCPARWTKLDHFLPLCSCSSAPLYRVSRLMLSLPFLVRLSTVHFACFWLKCVMYQHLARGILVRNKRFHFLSLMNIYLKIRNSSKPHNI